MGDGEEEVKVEEPVDEQANDQPQEAAGPGPVKEEKAHGDLGSKVKNWVIVLLLFMIISTLVVFFFWRSGLTDLKDDQSLLIVVQEKGVAKAGSIYDLAGKTAEPVNIDALPPLDDKKSFSMEAARLLERDVDKLIVLEVGTIAKLSTEPSLSYKGTDIPSRDVPGYISGSLYDEILRGADTDWMFRGKMLSKWIEVYDDGLLSSSFGSTSYTIILGDFRGGGITVYPRNYALLILRYIPVEQIFL